VLDAALAADEWPLRYVAISLGMGGAGQLFSSVEVLHMLEAAGSLGRDARMQTLRAWIRQAEALERGGLRATKRSSARQRRTVSPTTRPAPERRQARRPC